MKPILIITALVALSGCNVKTTTDPIFLYQCNKEQLELVQTEMNICLQSGYFTSVCYESAKRTQCTKMNVEDTDD